jgi:N-acetylglucosamine kinase
VEHVLGIDAGGTKTVCLLADDRGRVVAEARGGGANLQSAGELEVEKVLHRVMDEAIGDRDLRPAAICLGIAGVDRPDDAEAVHGIMRRIGSKTRTLVVNDALIALVAGAGDKPGVVVVAGTGSIAYGRNAEWRAARAGGWGYLLGDEGGGFWIGRAALVAVAREFDGRGPRTLLTELVLAEMGLSAADAGDAIASEIVDRAAAELAAAAASVITRLAMRGEPFPTILSGGVFRGLPTIVDKVASRVAEVAPRSDVRRLEVEPALGAVTLALAAARGPVTIPSYE